MSVVFPLSNQFNVVFPAPPPSYSKALLDTATPGSYTVSLDESLYTFVILIGAGGGGQSGNITGSSGVAGYGGAAMIVVFAPNTTGSLSITVGAGGAGGAASTSSTQNAGSAGGASTLGWGGTIYFTCGGGGGGGASGAANGTFSIASGAPIPYLGAGFQNGNPVFQYVKGAQQTVGATGAYSSSGAGGTGGTGGIGAGGGGGGDGSTQGGAGGQGGPGYALVLQFGE